jgi:hypothetical protein
MAGCVGYDDERDSACAIQGLWKVVCQPLVVWLCANPRSYVPFNELILGWEISLHSPSNKGANIKES